MKLISKLLFCFLYVHFGFNSLSAQVNQSKNIIKQLDELYRLKKIDTVILISNKTLESLDPKNSKDSLLMSKLYLYKYLGFHSRKKTIQNLTFLNSGIKYCPKSISGDSLKAALYNTKAYLENELGAGMKSYRSISNSLKLLEKLPNPNPGGLMGAYLLLSSKNAYYGNFTQAKYCMRLAEDTYAKNKTEIDNSTWELNGNHHRMGVILKYRKIYMYWKLSKDSKDSLSMVNTMHSLEKMHGLSDFHKEERIYYSTALNHIGDWFVSHNQDSLTLEKNVKLGLQFLLKSYNLVQHKKYPGTLWAIKYNIAKAYTKGNLLEKADSTMSVLFKGISKTDGRLPFFYAQKALIKAKKNQKDSALLYFDKSVEKIHQGENVLNTNYNNFKPSKSYNHTRLLLRVSEELNNYYPKDSTVQKKKAKLYYLALQQFENSYLNTNFNSKQNKQLRQILQGVLRMKKTGYLEDNINKKTLLNKFEIFKNQLAWKKFYQNRYTNTLPELDSVNERKVELASLLNKAKISNNISLGDSIQRLIYQHESYQKKQFPQLELLSNFEFSIEKLQNELSSKDLILKYVLLENELAIYQISRTEIKTHLLPWTKKEEEILSDFIKKTRETNYDYELGSQLGRILFPFIENNVTNLIINPDGVLLKLPFEILSVNGKFATELYNFSYTSNLGFINYKSNRDSTSEKIHIYAPHYSNKTNPSSLRNNKLTFLKGASNEAKSISKLFPSILFNDENLTKSEFIRTAKNGKILHLAMHAEVNKEYPELSRLLFSNNLEKEDEHLYLEELYGLSLNAELAILSACNTGSGVEKHGNLESFQRAFTFAGVPATVVSLWEVPDVSTEQIMVLFYKNLKAGHPKSEALKKAKLSYKEKNTSSKLSEPYYWAGFVVYGSDAPVANTFSSELFYLIGFVIITALLILFLKKKYQLF